MIILPSCSVGNTVAGQMLRYKLDANVCLTVKCRQFQLRFHYYFLLHLSIFILVFNKLYTKQIFIRLCLNQQIRKTL